MGFDRWAWVLLSVWRFASHAVLGHYFRSTSAHLGETRSSLLFSECRFLSYTVRSKQEAGNPFELAGAEFYDRPTDIHRGVKVRLYEFTKNQAPNTNHGRYVLSRRPIRLLFMVQRGGFGHNY